MSDTSTAHRGTSRNVLPQYSAVLHSELDDALRAMFPDSYSGQCRSDDITKLSAVLYKSRALAMYDGPQLSPDATFAAVQKLIKRPPAPFLNDQSLIRLRQYLTPLSEALLAFRKQVAALQHDYRNEWYAGATTLDQDGQWARKNCPPNLQIEKWDVLFLIKHIQYLVLSIRDSFSSGDKLFEFGGQMIRGALQGYGSQYVDAIATAKDLLHRKRTRAKWHEHYLSLEEKCFKAVAHPLESGPNREAKRATDELNAIIALRNGLEEEIHHHSGFQRGLRSVGGFVGRSLQSSGSYEENDYYFAYGLLNLLYIMSFRVRNRVPCFEEIIGAVFHTLERSPRSTSHLHRKAVDIYQRIVEQGALDGVTYGKSAEVDAINQWLAQNPNQFDSPESSSRRALQIQDEICHIEDSDAILETLRGRALMGEWSDSKAGLQGRKIPARSPTVLSDIFPPVPVADPFIENHAPSAIPLINSPVLSSPGHTEQNLEDDYFSLSPSTTLDHSGNVVREKSNQTDMITPEQLDLLDQLITPTNSLSIVPEEDKDLIVIDEVDILPIPLQNEPTITPIDYKASLRTLPCFKHKLKEKFQLIAISASGSKVAILAKRKFWVFDTNSVPPSLLCIGEFSQGRKYRYGKDERLETQHPIIEENITEFSAAALSDHYLAIAAPGHVMAFTVSTEHAGRWVVSYKIPYDDLALIERLKFTLDGEELLAMLRAVVGNSSQVRAMVFQSRSFPGSDFHRSKPQTPQIQEIILDDWGLYRPTGIAFSTKGTLASICTSHSEYRAGIQLLRKMNSGEWSSWGGLKKVDVFDSKGDQRDWTGSGLTGISFFGMDRSIVVSIETSFKEAFDCYEIIPIYGGSDFQLKPLRKVADRETTHLAVAVSQLYSAIALVNNKGQLQIFKSDTDKRDTINRRSDHRRYPDELGLSFSSSGNRLVLLDIMGNIEIHDFIPGGLGSLSPLPTPQPLIHL